jgi:rfaE bifunctional protein nucleotidyltransferase chain/domain
MGEIISISQISEKVKQLKNTNKKIILAGGCFDILHPGHIQFLQEAKNIGGTLFVMLESDKRITELKGDNRPIHSQQDRSYILSHLSMVDYVLLLPYFTSNTEYDELVISLQPDYIAITKDDPVIQYVQRQAKLVNAQVRTVIPRINNHASSNIIKELNI